MILFASTQTAVCDVFTQVGIPITLYSFPIFILFTDSSKIIKDKRKYVFLVFFFFIGARNGNAKMMS